ncbi:MAG: 30S ribosomal protein S14 [Rhodospirillaceae bacterium]|nr:MAG: 30S ribosomal protein S14 [Rhodospirillaceae bacterium]
MAKKSAIARNENRKKIVARYAEKRAKLKLSTRDLSLSPEERFNAQLKLAALPKNSSGVRLHNRCRLTGRSHGVYRKFNLSRIALRELALKGQIPGMLKSSW